MLIKSIIMVFLRKNLYTCVNCGEEYLLDNNHCTGCGQDWCPRCATWWDEGRDYCYSCREGDEAGGGDEEEDGTQSNPIDLTDEKEEDEEDNLVKT